MSRRVAALTIRFPAGANDDDRGLASARLSDFSTAAIHELTDTEWRAFFRTAEDRDAAAAALAREYDIECIDVADEDWARRSQENLRAITVADVVVAPPWDVPDLRSQSSGLRQKPLVIVIEPSTGFGTGHHATTRLCLRALQQIELQGKTGIDVGTGSGVLAIAAALRGAARVIAVDNDPDAIEAARANIERNGAQVDLRLGDIETLALQRADVVMANLTGAMLRRNAEALAALGRGGILIVSGFLAEEVPDVERAFAPLVAHQERADEDGWSALVVRT